jgi:hypothetical protein
MLKLAVDPWPMVADEIAANGKLFPPVAAK